MSEFRIACPGCGKTVEGDAKPAGTDVMCPHCNHPFKAPARLKPASGPPDAPPPARPGFGETIVGHVTRIAGEDRIEGFSLRELFSQVFARHPSSEIEESFTVGTPSTTPSISEVDPSWPHPWLFFRMFVGALVVYAAFVLAWDQYHNTNLVPGLILVGSFAVPLSLIVFFIEVNARRNVSLYQVLRLTFAGGVLGIILSLVLYQLTDAVKLGWLGAPIAGLVEEPGKLVAVLLVVGSMRHRYILNGLLFGAAIGAGFAAFESAGYALRAGFDSDASMKHVIVLRGVLSPFGHIPWTGMCAAALWKVMGRAKFEWAMLKDHRFLRVVGIAVGCHMIWDCSFELPFYAKEVILGVVAWIVILALIQDGLRQLRDEKAAAAEPITAAVVEK